MRDISTKTDYSHKNVKISLCKFKIRVIYTQHPVDGYTSKRIGGRKTNRCPAHGNRGSNCFIIQEL